MADTVIGVGDTKAVKRWSTSLAVDTNAKQYWSKFIGEGENNVIQRMNELEKEAGDKVQYDLLVQLRKPPVRGDNRVQGLEEEMRFFTDELVIDQLRHPVNAGGKMTRKRTLHNLRKRARDLLSDYWAKYMDEICFIVMSGARGINEDFIEPLDYATQNGNALLAPDAGHILYGGDATGKADLATADKMDRVMIERAETYARMIRATNPNMTNIHPIMVEGGKHFVVLMSTYQEHDMRTASGSDWLEIQKAAAGAEGRKNPIFKGKLGMIKDVVLHSHENVIRFDDYGVGSNVEAARALFLGRQAGAIAYGTSGGPRFQWEEELTDYKNNVGISAGCIFGLKKTRYNGKDFGVIAIDTAAAAVN